MDNLSCHAIYVDKRAHLEGFFKRASESGSETSSERGSPSPSNAGGANDIQSSLMVLSAIFNGVHVLKSGKSCMTKLRKLNANSEEDLKPILVFVDTSDDFPTSGKPLVRALTNGSEPSPTSSPTHPRFGQPDAIDPDDRHGLALLQLIVAEISCLNLSRLVIPIALVKCTTPTKDERSRDSQPPGMHSIRAIDVLTCPLQGTRILSLTAHAYRAHKEALRDQAAFLANKRLRKRSWVGVEDSRPYGWLRESM
ncbi:3',5'-cyclic-nucleotide phosphodiesterase [Agyrium rufum]|nr:3',5'-cyclic-nucleotide phosphodiesterase [Agyrium rufum]